MQEYIDKLTKFVDFAHSEQEYDNRSYMVHINHVIDVLLRHGYDSITHMECALLHDVIEDVKWVTEQVLEDFGVSETVIDAVKFCTDSEGHNRKTRKAKTMARWSECIEEWSKKKKLYSWVPIAIRVKVADRIANFAYSKSRNSGLFKMYQKEYEKFRSVLYTPGVCENMWKYLDELVNNE